VRLAPVRLHVPVPVSVEDAELHRIHADEVRQLVHLAFEREIDRHCVKGGKEHAVGNPEQAAGQQQAQRRQPDQ
jgi:hypothetical protein